MNLANSIDLNNPSPGYGANLAIALISPSEQRRDAAARSAAAICEVSSYVFNAADMEELSQRHYDVMMIDIEDDTERVLKLVEIFSSDGNSKVLVYSTSISREILARCICAGARDFLAFPFEPAAMKEALDRLSNPQPAAPAPRKAPEPAQSQAKPKRGWRRLFNSFSLARS